MSREADFVIPDLRQCEGLQSGAFVLGPGYVRCTNKPTTVFTEVKPSRAGLCGSMGLCRTCSVAFVALNGEDFATQDPIIPAHEREDRA